MLSSLYLLSSPHRSDAHAVQIIIPGHTQKRMQSARAHQDRLRNQEKTW